MTAQLYSAIIIINCVVEMLMPIFPITFINICLLILSLIIYNISIYKWNLNIILLVLGLNMVILFSLITKNIFWFYYGFELLLLPIYLLVYYFGYTEDRKFSSLFFVYFALISSLLWLITIIILYTNGKSNIINPMLISIGFLIPILVKVPIMPLHLWLNEIHTGSPVSGSIILAGIILKISIYAILIFYIPIFGLFTLNMFDFRDYLLNLIIPAVLLSALSTIRQVDYKRLIAYSSVNHMNIILFATITYNFQSDLGSIIFCLGHGIISSLLFIQANSLYERFNTRNIYLYSGVLYIMPILTYFGLLTSLANMGFPPSINWFAELYILLDNYIYYFYSVFSIAISIIFTIYYSFWAFYRIYFGSLINNYFSDITRIEFYLNSICSFLFVFATFYIYT